jgi:signal transduction histidine kinase
LKFETSPKSDVARYLDVISRSVDQAAKLVDNVLDLATIEAKAVELHWETFPILDLLQGSALKFRLSAAQRGLTLVLEPSNSPVLVRGDIGLIERVVDNLVGDSRDHTHPGAVIRSRVQLGTGKCDCVRLRYGARDLGGGDSLYRAPGSSEQKEAIRALRRMPDLASR